MRKKGEVAVKKARSKYGFGTGVPGECYSIDLRKAYGIAGVEYCSYRAKGQ
jgi:hypothetical protein